MQKSRNLALALAQPLHDGGGEEHRGCGCRDEEQHLRQHKVGVAVKACRNDGKRRMVAEDPLQFEHGEGDQHARGGGNVDVPGYLGQQNCDHQHVNEKEGNSGACDSSGKMEEDGHAHPIKCNLDDNDPAGLAKKALRPGGDFPTPPTEEDRVVDEDQGAKQVEGFFGQREMKESHPDRGGQQERRTGHPTQSDHPAAGRGHVT